MSFADAAKALTLPTSKLFEGLETDKELDGKALHMTVLAEPVQPSGAKTACAAAQQYENCYDMDDSNKQRAIGSQAQADTGSPAS